MTWPEQLGTERQGLQFVKSIEELRSLEHLSTPHAVEVAWERMELDGVVIVGRSAGIYIKEVEAFDANAEHRLHAKLWLHGTAPLLVVIDPSQVRVYSSRPKKPGHAPAGKRSCIEVLDRVKQAIEISHLVEHVQLGDYFETHREHFRPSNAVDYHFREVLECTRDALVEIDKRVALPKIHELLVRSLLLRYLSDRGALSPSFFKRHLGSDAGDLAGYFAVRTSARTSLSRAFEGIHAALGFHELAGFHDLVSDTALRDDHFELVVRFLSGEEADTGQLALGDWVYDLSLLPVELISTVYQEFVSAEVENAKKEIGLVATPRFVAEAVLDFAFDDLAFEQPAVLDPACGSGIFLVGCFNRLAHRLQRERPGLSSRESLARLATLLREKLVGVELRPTACELARLNLLHALLGHFSDAQLRRLLQGTANESERNRRATHIVAGNFFDEHTELVGASFDLIVGNPPWSKDRDAMAAWLTTKPDDVGIPDRSNLVYGFAWRTAEYLAEKGRACLLLDAKAMLTSPNARRFAERWYMTHRVDTIVNLTALRAHLFGGTAGRAAGIFRFGRHKPCPTDSVHYLTPAASDAVRRGALLDLSQARAQQIMYTEVMAAARCGTLPHLWRVRLHGTGRDANLIDRLQGLQRLKDVVAREGWFFNQGFNRHGGHNTPEKRAMLDEIPYLPTKNIGLWAYRFPSRTLTRPYGKEDNERSRMVRDWPCNAEQLFKGERVVMHQTPLIDPPMLRAAYVTRNFTFHKEQKALSAPPGNTDLLKFIAAALSSSLAFYYYFHTSMSWGVEAQPQVRKGDLLEFPLPMLQTEHARQLRNEVVRLVDGVSPSGSVEAYRDSILERRDEINRVILECYELDEWEADLVTDCERHLSKLVYGQTTGPWKPHEKQNDCRDYVQRLTSALNRWTRQGVVSGKAYVSDEAGLGLVVLHREAGDGGNVVEVLDDDDQLARLLREVHLLLKKRGSSRPARDVMVFEGTSLYMTKPLQRRCWTRTAALNDADMIAAAIIGSLPE
jgi:hypothetical protein